VFPRITSKTFKQRRVCVLVFKDNIEEEIMMQSNFRKRNPREKWIVMEEKDTEKYVGPL
jgi:hypothetical protein